MRVIGESCSTGLTHLWDGANPEKSSSALPYNRVGPIFRKSLMAPVSPLLGPMLPVRDPIEKETMGVMWPAAPTPNAESHFRLSEQAANTKPLQYEFF